ncbi:hypothetical protein PHMEG_00028203 [Phytophthora megakarya]|uniref:DDE-1 domain-containing protein n=1 Tax=Phytophthora megakarya TaxID=4795 RepID=A0A225V629_9STRA|nr:hypothetical protein PHMEG_00028203 [Phytophthora megakarya]
MLTGVSLGKKATIMQSYHDVGMEKTVEKYFPALREAEQKSKSRQIYKWLKRKRRYNVLFKWAVHISRRFSASPCWKKRFLAKFTRSLRCKTRIGPITPADSAQVVQKFRLEVLNTIEEEGIVVVFNTDQTTMNYEYLPTRTYDTKGTRTVWVHNAGAQKKRMTVMLLSDMHGNRKTPFAVFKQPPSTVPATETYNHQNQNGLAMIGVVLLKIPLGYTASCQPADIAWMKPFKLVLRSLWVDHLQSQLRVHQERSSQTQYKLEASSRPTLMAWLTSAWEGLPAATLESGFRKLNIPTDNRVLPSRDPVLHDRDIDDLVDRLEALRWCEEVGTDFGL